MDKINIVKAPFLAIALEHIDTDQIIPARFLKATKRDNFSEALFADWRNEPDFPLNCFPDRKKILVAGKNFGCGSSREHAAWALSDYGFQLIISSEFADIFKNNAFNNGLLAIEVSELFLQKLLASTGEEEIHVSLEEQKIHWKSYVEHFEINAYKKNKLLNGMDDFSYLLSLEQEITRFEATHIYGTP